LGGVGGQPIRGGELKLCRRSRMLVLGRRFWSVGPVSTVSSSDHQSVGKSTYEALGAVVTKHLYQKKTRSKDAKFCKEVKFGVLTRRIKI
jgi:hypothetical protein